MQHIKAIYKNSVMKGKKTMSLWRGELYYRDSELRCIPDIYIFLKIHC